MNFQNIRNGILKPFSFLDYVYKSVFKKEFRTLESLGKFRAGRLFYYPCPRKADKGVRLGYNHVALHGKSSR